MPIDGGYAIAKDHVRGAKRSPQEMFVPLSHPPGHGQADIGEALVVCDGIGQQASFFAFDLPHRDACYIHAYPAANTDSCPLSADCCAIAAGQRIALTSMQFPASTG